MENLTVKGVAQMINGEIINEGKDNIIDNVVIDSRKVEANSLFFALPGTAFDGHDFVKMASEKGASAAVVTKLVEGADLYQIKVEDTLKGLYKLAGEYKKRYDIPYLSLTGSAGKTSTKDMVSSVLSQKYNTMKTIGNFNSTTGVPLTLFNLNKDHEIAVVEMGMNHKDEISQVSKLVKPDYAMITNVGLTHIENLGSKENIFKAKMEITEGLKKGGTLVVNGDNEFFKDLELADYKLVKLGLESGDYVAKNVEYTNKGVSFDFEYEGKSYSFKVYPPAKYSIYNAMFAIYAGFTYGLTYEQIKKGIEEFVPSSNRMKIENVNGIKIINDTYNSNPDALREALGLLKNLSDGRRTVAVVGDMFELGEKSNEEHYNISSSVIEKGIDMVLACGDASLNIIKGLKDKGFNEDMAVPFESKDELTKNIYDYIKKDDVVLFKASRGMAFETIVEAVKKGGNR